MRDRKEYMSRRYRERMEKSIEHLGGECVRCGTTEELQIDHTDPSTKGFTLTDKWHLRWELYVMELDKCQLLCKPHHLEKTVSEKRLEHGTGKYGTKRCKCDECKATRAQYYREWYAKHGRKRAEVAEQKRGSLQS